MVDEQFAIEIHDTSFARETIIEEDTILGRAYEATNIYLPIRMPESIRLLNVNIEVLVEVQHHNVRGTTFFLPILWRTATEIAFTRCWRGRWRRIDIIEIRFATW